MLCFASHRLARYKYSLKLLLSKVSRENQQNERIRKKKRKKKKKSKKRRTRELAKERKYQGKKKAEDKLL